VITPTRARPHLLSRAIDSVLSQTFSDFEMIVVVDGPDPQTQAVLEQYNDPRLRWLVQTEPTGLPYVRTTGIDQARGQWIAFLDDDDEWLPRKLEVQVEMLSRSKAEYPVGFARFIARTADRDYVWPHRGPGAGEPISDYLFKRTGLFTGEGVILPTTIVIPRRLLAKVPWAATTTQNRHEDWDWYMRAAAFGASFEFAAERLAIWHIENDHPRISTSASWRYSFDWAQRRRELMTPAAYSSFLLVAVTGFAARSKDWSAWPVLWREARKANGLPRPIDIALFLGIRLLPEERRRRLRGLRKLWPHSPDGKSEPASTRVAALL
jgi:glycosyltransferase involved in cell wall biosynthesis